LSSFVPAIRHIGSMTNRNAYVLGLCAMMLIVFAYCFWINLAH